MIEDTRQEDWSEHDRIEREEKIKANQVNDDYEELLKKGYIDKGYVKNSLTGKLKRNELTIGELTGNCSDLEVEDIDNIILAVLKGEEPDRARLEEIIKGLL